MNLKNSCGRIPGYQARKGLHTGTVKIDPHRFCRVKVLEYLQKTKTLKMTFFLDQSFGIGAYVFY